MVRAGDQRHGRQPQLLHQPRRAKHLQRRCRPNRPRCLGRAGGGRGQPHPRARHDGARRTLGRGGLHKPIVRLKATRPQAAEGGSEPGQFTVYRDSADLSQPLAVSYTVTGSAGQATPGVDYTALTGTVTIPANADSVTIDVTALRDSDASESVEPVSITLNASPLYAVATPGPVTVNVLNRKKYLVSFYGLNGPETDGDRWLTKLIDRLKQTSYAPDAVFPHKHFEWKQALQSFLGAIDADANKRISKAEGESADLRVTGFSLGGTQAVNFTRDLNKDVWFGGRAARNAGFTLEANVQVHKLVTLDPVEVLRIGAVRLLPFKTVTGSVETNVESFVNYYQTALGPGTVVDVKTQNRRRFDALGGRIIVGGTMPSKIVAQQSDVTKGAFAAATEDRDRMFGNEGDLGDPLQIDASEPQWRLIGADNSHLSIGFYAYRMMENELR